MADGQATKIIFPFELSSVVKQAAEYLGATAESADIPEGTELPSEDILGEIPGPEALRAAEEAARSIDTNIDAEIQKRAQNLMGEGE